MSLRNISLGIIVLAIILTGCPNLAGNGGNNGNNDNNENQQSKKLTLGYLSNLMVDIGDAAGLGIEKRAVQRTNSRSIRAVTDVTEIVEKNYLVKITTDISHGNVEWNESSLTNVTFKKKTTIDTTVYVPVYDDDGNPVYLTDDEGNPILDKDGEPIVEIQIIEDQTITQDEIPAQVNKLYVYNNYTFIQFVPVEITGIEDVRPNDLGTSDGDGYYDYDKHNYYNDDFHQSFVIENSTGNIYSVENSVHIAAIHNGLLNIEGSSYIWDCRIKDNNELEIFSLNQNAMLAVGDYYKDKYGNNYIFTESFNHFDATTNTIYSSKAEYHVASSGEVIYTRNGFFSDYTADYSFWVHIGSDHNANNYFERSDGGFGSDEIKVVCADFQYRSVTSDDEFYFNGYNGATEKYGGYISHIKDKKLYLYGILAGNEIMYWVLNTDTSSYENAFGIYDSIPVSYNTFIISDNSAKTLRGYKFDYDTLTYETRGSTVYAELDSTTMVFELENAEDRYNRGIWYVTTLDGEVEYQVVLKEVDGEKIPLAIKTSEYVAEEQQVITLKPINR